MLFNLPAILIVGPRIAGWIAARDEEITDAALSSRQMERVAARMFEELVLPAGSWRSLLRMTRLGFAALLLSAPDLTIREIAKAVGYASAEALTNAFPRAGLPAPTTVQSRRRVG